MAHGQDASSECLPWQEAFAERSPLFFGSIQTQAGDVFDTSLQAETLALHRLANQLHKQTQPSVIEQQLLFSSGDPFNLELLQETERHLRAQSYLRHASVTATELCGNTVTIQVLTADHWSLIPSFTFTRAGGQNRVALKLSEMNLLGMGKTLEFLLDYNNERDQQVLYYFDPQLLGSRTRLATLLQDNSDGKVQQLILEQPFFALNTPKAWRIEFSNSEYSRRHYADGQAIRSFGVDHETVDISWGYSSGMRQAQVLRWRLGWEFDQYAFQPTAGFSVDQTLPNRRFSAPYLELQWLRPRYLKKTNMAVMGEVEDIAIGHNLTTRIGMALSAFDNTQSTLVFSSLYSRGWDLSERYLALIQAKVSGYQSRDSLQQLVTSGSARLYAFQTRKSSLFFSAYWLYGDHVFADTQWTLGGDNGLRGYPLNFQTGTRRVNASLEQRYYFDWYPLRLVRIGAAVFADIGAAWSDSQSPQWLRDAGIGLRIASPRQANAKVMHIDLAFPFDELNRIEQVQVLVSAKTQF